jgi:hypothetical protein
MASTLAWFLPGALPISTFPPRLLALHHPAYAGDFGFNISSVICCGRYRALRVQPTVGFEADMHRGSAGVLRDVGQRFLEDAE